MSCEWHNAQLPEPSKSAVEKVTKSSGNDGVVGIVDVVDDVVVVAVGVVVVDGVVVVGGVVMVVGGVVAVVTGDEDDEPPQEVNSITEINIVATSDDNSDLLILKPPALLSDC